MHKAVAVMDNKTNIQCNKTHHLEDTMIMYGVYNSNTLKNLIGKVHRIQNFTTWKKKTFAERLHDWKELYSHDKDVHHYAINSVLFMTTVREKYVKMYKRFIEELKLYLKAIQNFIKRVSTHLFTTTIKIGKNSKRSENSNCKIKQRL